MAHKSKQDKENAIGVEEKSSEKEVWINEKLKSNLLAIMSLHPDGLPASQLCREYSKHYGVDLDVRYWGCHFVAEFCAMLPEVFKMVRGGKDGNYEDWMLYSPAEVRSDSKYGSLREDSKYGSGGVDSKYGSGGVDSKYGSGGDDSMYGSLREDSKYGSLREDSKYGSRGADSKYGSRGVDSKYGSRGVDSKYGSRGVDSKYGSRGVDSKYGSRGVDSKYGSRGVDSKYGSGGEDSKFVSRGGDRIISHIFNKTFGSTCQSNTSSNTKMEHVSVSRPMLRSRNVKLNKKCANILGPNEKIPRQELPGNIKLGDFLEVVVAEVVSPGRFWIQLKGKDTNKALVWLQEEIKEFYGKSFEKYKIQDEDFFSDGMVCVCLHSDGYWYRASVTSFQDLTTVEVFFIDYGNVFKVKKGSLAYLHRKFGKLPGQAFEARLDGIKPAAGRREFSNEATQRFLQLTDVFMDDTEYMGLVAVVRGLGERLSLWMVETCTNDLPEGIVINKVLVDELLAVEDNKVLVDELLAVEDNKVLVDELLAVEDNKVLVDELLAVEDASSGRDVVDLDTLLSLPTLEMSTHALVDLWLDKMLKLNLGSEKLIDGEVTEQLKLNLGSDNLIDGEVTEEPSLPNERDQDSMQQKLLHWVKMGGLDCHIAVKEGSAWMTSRQVSRFIPNWKGKNLLPRMLELKRMVVSSLTVTPISDPSLHAILKGALKDENCEEIILYPLKSIPYILDLFLQVPGTHLRLALQFQIENFERINEQNL